MKPTNKTSTLFWNVDTQIDFMKSDGKLYVQDAEEIEPTLEKLTRLASKHHIRVVNSCDYHNENSAELSNNPDFIKTFPPHCIKDTVGQAFVEATKPDSAAILNWDTSYSLEEINELLSQHRNIVIRKDVFDVFANNPNAENVLKLLAPQQIFVYGVASNVCVDFAVKGLLKRGYNVYVVEDAIKGLPNIPSPLQDWKTQGASLITSQDILNAGALT